MEKSKKHIVHLGKSLFILLFTFTMSCEEPVELNLENTETKLVINSHFTPDEHFEVFLSRSLFAESDEFAEYPTDAEVKLYKGNEVLETLWPVNRSPKYPFFSYQSKNVKPEVGIEYTIRAEVPKLEKVSASSTVPAPSILKEVGISSLNKEYPVDDDSTIVDYTFDLAIEIEATTALPAYYHLDVNYELVAYIIDESDTIRTYSGDFTHIVLENTDGDFEGLTHYAEGILIKQASTDNLILHFKTRTPDPVQTSIDLFDKLYIDLRTVSKDYYLYHNKLTRQFEYDGDVLNEPVLLHNNVNNGYGIFAGYSLSRDSVIVHTE